MEVVPCCENKKKTGCIVRQLLQVFNLSDDFESIPLFTGSVFHNVCQWQQVFFGPMTSLLKFRARHTSLEAGQNIHNYYWTERHPCLPSCRSGFDQNHRQQPKHQHDQLYSNSLLWTQTTTAQPPIAAKEIAFLQALDSFRLRCTAEVALLILTELIKGHTGTDVLWSGAGLCTA